MKLYSIGNFAKEINKTVQTLRNWDKDNKLKPYFVSPLGHRYYSQDNLIIYYIFNTLRQKRKCYWLL